MPKIVLVDESIQLSASDREGLARSLINNFSEEMLQGVVNFVRQEYPFVYAKALYTRQVCLCDANYQIPPSNEIIRTVGLIMRLREDIDGGVDIVSAISRNVIENAFPLLSLDDIELVIKAAKKVAAAQIVDNDQSLEPVAYVYEQLPLHLINLSYELSRAYVVAMQVSVSRDRT